MASSEEQARPSNRHGLWGVPLGVIAIAALVVPAFASWLLIRSGIANRSGAAIAIGVVVGAFWLMLLLQTARSAVGPASKVRD